MRRSVFTNPDLLAGVQTEMTFASDTNTDRFVEQTIRCHIQICILYVVHGVLLTTSERRVKKFADAHVNQNKYKLSQSAAVWWYLYDWEANAVYN